MSTFTPTLTSITITRHAVKATSTQRRSRGARVQRALWPMPVKSRGYRAITLKCTRLRERNLRAYVLNRNTRVRNAAMLRSARHSTKRSSFPSHERLRTSYPLSELEKVAVAVVNMKIAHAELRQVRRLTGKFYSPRAKNGCRGIDIGNFKSKMHDPLSEMLCQDFFPC